MLYQDNYWRSEDYIENNISRWYRQLNEAESELDKEIIRNRIQRAKKELENLESMRLDG